VGVPSGMSIFRNALVALLVLPVVSHAGSSVPCNAGRIELEAGSTVDLGTTGLLHSAELTAGAAIGFDIVSRCSDDASGCLTNADCESDLCTATCDCSSDTTCEIAGPLGNRRCIGTLETCSSDDDCGGPDMCVPFFAPPQPFVAAGFPSCVNTHFDGAVTGSLETGSGEASLSGRLVWRFFLGISQTTPCPRCGAPEDDPAIGDAGTCEGGPRNGLACTVDGVTDAFGGVSYDCPPPLNANVSGPGLIVPLFEMTTGETVRSAALPCSFFGFTGNPLVPGSNPKCSDARAEEDPVCTSNADCQRCSANLAVACTSNGDCTGAGICAEAPAQPIECGFWCHCGFCDGDASKPCLGDGDCPDGGECSRGSVDGHKPGAPQRFPNNCSLDGFVCGTADPEECESTELGFCELEPQRFCSSNNDCVEGPCTGSPLPCFESRIAREGSPSPLGTYCALERKACSSNADCTEPGDECRSESALPSLAGLSCVSGSSSAPINAQFGLTGPAAFDWNTRLTVCACEGTEPGCEEVCDADPGCGDGILQPSEDCEGGPCCTGDCTFEDTSVTCRAAAGDCDAAENCSGSSASCPTDAPVDDGTPCDDETDCSTEDVCTGGQCGGLTDCGDGMVDEACGEECDDGNTADGDGCSQTCGPQTLCGDATEDGQILTGDAQRILQKAVGLDVECAMAVCDVDSSGAVQTNDALRILRTAVDLESELICDYGS
jgi:hypothetical protein